MSGTSRDGIDAALIRTDGEGEVDPVAFVSMPYDYSFRSRLAEACLKAMAMAKPGHGFQTSLRSEEHTSELQSLMRISYAVFSLKKQNIKDNHNEQHNKT